MEKKNLSKERNSFLMNCSYEANGIIVTIDSRLHGHGNENWAQRKEVRIIFLKL